MSCSVNSAEPRQAVCSLEGVEKSFGSLHALGPVSLSLYPGELVGLRGSNGAGKSTLLKLLAGLLPPDRGSRALQPGLERQVSYLPQDIALYSGMTALQNIEFWASVYGLPRKASKARSRWLLERLDLSHKARARADTLSGGMLRRLHLATALTITPALLLLDEPTAGADAHSADLILRLLDEYRSRGSSILLVSHRAGELEEHATRLLTLEGGRLTPSGGAG